jgi:3-hydroxyisobutyrate dehydrogenase-like beta-hydroxyacid dehydrogenase
MHCLTAPMTMAVNALKLFREASASGYGEQDMAAIVEHFRK